MLSNKPSRGHERPFLQFGPNRSVIKLIQLAVSNDASRREMARHNKKVSPLRASCQQSCLSQEHRYNVQVGRKMTSARLNNLRTYH